MVLVRQHSSTCTYNTKLSWTSRKKRRARCDWWQVLISFMPILSTGYACDRGNWPEDEICCKHFFLVAFWMWNQAGDNTVQYVLTAQRGLIQVRKLSLWLTPLLFVPCIVGLSEHWPCMGLDQKAKPPSYLLDRIHRHKQQKGHELSWSARALRGLFLVSIK